MLNTQMIWMMFIKFLKNTTHRRNTKYLLFLIWLLICLVIKNNLVVTELFIRGRKLNVPLVFITQSYNAVPKKRLNFMHNFVMKITKDNKLRLIIHQILTLRDFMNLYKTCTTKPYSLLVIDATLASDNLLHFRKNLSERI